MLAAEVALPGGEEIDYSPDGKWVYAATPSQAYIGQYPTRLVKISTDSHEIVGEVELEAMISAIRVAPDGTVLVTQLRRLGEHDRQPGTRLWVIDPETMTIKGSVPLDRGSFTIRVSDDSGTAYVADPAVGAISVVDLARYSLRSTLDSTIGPDYGGTHGLCLATLH